jgi:Tol biopolymer transport system component
MTVVPGTRLGPYEIVSRIGAGGMGEVFRARDTRLDRSVAVKILPGEFAENAQLRARFEREARAISQLSHPNICTLFDVGENYLVMELLEGDTLADRLARGPLPIREVLRIGMQIADALDRAHRSGIIHRDLKPGNVMLTKSGAKLLDFGLAKGGAAAVNLDGATEQRPLTQEGTILGTFQYMSPEQLEGADVDARSDIFAFGAVLYEMATGHRAFDGKTKTSLIAAIVAAEPKPMAELQPLTPPALEMLIRACIAKDPEERIQTAHDVALQLRWISETVTSQSSATAIALPRRRKWTAAIAALAALMAAAATWFAATRWERSHTVRPVYRATIESAEGSPLGYGSGAMALSPDGSMLAYAGIAKSGDTMLFLRKLDETVWRPLEGTEGAWGPFWSPDGKRLAFFRNDKLMKVMANGSAATEIVATIGNDGTGGYWSDDAIIYARAEHGIFRVSAGGGEPVSLLTAAKPTDTIVTPRILPDGKHLVYGVETSSAAAGGTWITAIDGSEKPRPFLKSDGAPRFVGDTIFFVRDGMLYAQAFDPRKVALTGQPHGIAAVQSYAGGRAAMFSVSENALVYLPSGSEVRTEFEHVDHSGKRLGTIGQPGFFFSPRLSPDAKKIASDMSDTHGNGDIWIWDVDRSTGNRFSFETENETLPVWSPDGKDIAYVYGLNLAWIVRKPASGGEAQTMVKNLPWQVIGDWSPDGKTILLTGSNNDYDADIYAYSLPDHKLTPMVQTKGNFDGAPRFSPDGKWFAYVSSSDSGRIDAFVQPFPPNGSKWQISTGGGAAPVWSHDGKTLYYVSNDGKLMQTAVSTENGFSVQTPQPMFGVRLRENSVEAAQYDVFPDGSFILNAVPDTATTPMTLIVNWREALAR